MKLSAGQVFTHRLALSLGKTIQELHDMPLTEYHRWLAFDRQHTLPDRCTELQLAQVGYAIACSNSRKPQQFKLRDFMPSANTTESFEEWRSSYGTQV